MTNDLISPKEAAQKAATEAKASAPDEAPKPVQRYPLDSAPKPAAINTSSLRTP